MIPKLHPFGYSACAFPALFSYKKRLPKKSPMPSTIPETIPPTPSHTSLTTSEATLPANIPAPIPITTFAANGIGAAARTAIVASDAAVPAAPETEPFNAPEATFPVVVDKSSPFTIDSTAAIPPPKAPPSFADDFAALAIPVDDCTPLNLLLTRGVSFVEIPLSFITFVTPCEGAFALNAAALSVVPTQLRRPILTILHPLDRIHRSLRTRSIFALNPLNDPIAPLRNQIYLTGG